MVAARIDTADQALARGARVVAPVHVPVAAEASAAEVAAVVEASAAEVAAVVEEVAAVVEVEGKGLASMEKFRGTQMNSRVTRRNSIQLTSIAYAIALACLSPFYVLAMQQPAAAPQPAKKQVVKVAAPAVYTGKKFDTPQQGADALVKAAGDFDISSLTQIFGPAGSDVVFSGEFGQDRQHAAEFTAQAREKMSVLVDPKNANRAFIIVGKEDWPFPVPLVKSGAKWSFDAVAGREELFYRRIGANEVDAIRICRGYVEAQHEYAMTPREGYGATQYAQRVISTPGKQDGLAWQNADGTWTGPIGEKIARAIEQGYTQRDDPYHGYFFKILKSQGPAAPMGKLDFVVKNMMIGGFALVAAPAIYGVTGMKTFIVSHDGVVYEKDLGVNSLEEFRKMEMFNPDLTWTPVRDEDR